MPELISKETLLYEAFGVLVNVSGGNLETQTPEWNRAFTRFRSHFDARLEIDQTTADLVNKLQNLLTNTDSQAFTRHLTILTS